MNRLVGTAATDVLLSGLDGSTNLTPSMPFTYLLTYLLMYAL